MQRAKWNAIKLICTRLYFLLPPSFVSPLFSSYFPRLPFSLLSHFQHFERCSRSLFPPLFTFRFSLSLSSLQESSHFCFPIPEFFASLSSSSFLPLPLPLPPPLPVELIIKEFFFFFFFFFFFVAEKSTEVFLLEKWRVRMDIFLFVLSRRRKGVPRNWDYDNVLRKDSRQGRSRNLLPRNFVTHGYIFQEI